MFKRILYPTDFSDHSKKCIDYLIFLKDCKISEVILLHVADIRIIANTDMMLEDGIDEEEIITNCRKTALRKLKEIASQLETAGLKAKIEFQTGVPFVQINKAAEAFDASLIILGHRGHNLAEELLLGSTAEKVARKSKRPVLLIR